MFSVNRIAFRIAGFPVYWYGIIIASALLLGTLLAMVREKRFNLKKDDSLSLVLLAVPLAVICARAYYVAFSWNLYRTDLMQIFNFREGGIAIYGAILGGLLAGAIFARHKKIHFGSLCDLAAPCLALGQAIGRWGNFFNQEAYGRLIESNALQFFPLGVYIQELGEWHYATFFYESIWCFLIVGLLLLGERTHFFKRRGDEFIAYGVLYAAERAVVEGLRTDSLMLMDIRVSQLLSFLIIVLAVLVLFFRSPRRTLRHMLLLLILLAGLLVCFRAGWFIPQFLLSVLVLVFFLPLYRCSTPPSSKKG